MILYTASSNGEVSAKDGKLVVNGKEITVFNCMDPERHRLEILRR